MSEFPNQPKFKVIKKLGQGAFGAAYKVLNEEDNNYYVIKKILLKSAKENEINELKNEAKILSNLQSENIVKYYDSFTDNDSFNIIMEYCDGLDLRKFIDDHKKSNDFIKKNIILHIISGICNGLKEIHDKTLIHRDLKPDNIFLKADLTVKIGDFGLTKQLKDANEYAKTQAGTMLYMAPEIIKGEKYNNKVDIWALGCIIYELCTLNYCFDSDSINGLIKKITESNHGEIDKELYGEDLQKLIDSLLDKNYKKRLNVDEIINIININFGISFMEKIMEMFQEDEAYQNYIIERDVLNSINQVEETIIAREKKFNLIKLYGGVYLMSLPLNLVALILTGGISLILYIAPRFLYNNLEIVRTIQNRLIIILREQLDKNITKQNIIIYNKENFDNKIIKIKNKLLKEKKLKDYKKLLQRILIYY